MDNKSNYTFSNKYNTSLDNIFSEQNSRMLMNNNTNLNFNNATNNYLGVSYFNNTTMNNPINTINPNNNSILSDNYLLPNKKPQINIKILPEKEYKIEENMNNKNMNFMEEFAKIKNIMNNDPSRNPNLKSQDCFDLYGYPLISSVDGYSLPQLNNGIKQKYLMKTLFDNKYIYINGKQYHRIMKRREVRKKIKESMNDNKNIKDKNNKKYHHESRHRHAMNRERGKGGRFIGKNKLENENNDKNKEDKNNILDNKEAKIFEKEENNNKNDNNNNIIEK